ncbi:hypothetical protein FHS40_008703 [Streptomyces spectabilis]|uniref:Uncharacterized protein n=1 Tax=Streptomyces spectabilis TaxID=68270 RepID=A0A7W8B3B1_STRST|nr:hypothetical protein [Streptomyces spectabilis]
MGGESVPYPRHRFPGAEGLDLFQHVDQRSSVVGARLEGEAQPRAALGAGGVAAQRGRPSRLASSSAGAARAECGCGARRCGAPEAAAIYPIRRRTRSRHVPSPPPISVRGRSWAAHRAISDPSAPRPGAWDAASSAPAARSAGATRTPAPVSPRSPAPPPGRPAPRATGRLRVRATEQRAPTRPGQLRLAHHPAWAAGRWPDAAAAPEHRPATISVSTTARSRDGFPLSPRSRHGDGPTRTARPPACDGPRPTEVVTEAERTHRKPRTATRKTHQQPHTAEAPAPTELTKIQS